MSKKLAIFDSGIGGLSVVKRVIEYLPKYSLIYFGDTARVPYGTRSNAIIRKYAEQAVDFLISKGAGLILIGCNSASALAYSHLKLKYDIPIIDIINPAVRAAYALSSNKKIGIIGTQATINSNAHSNYLKNFNPKVKVFTKACPLLVSLAESGGLSGLITNQILFEYISPIKKEGIDTLVLGCTHYPYFTKAIQKIFPNIKLIDPGKEIAFTLNEFLKNNKKLDNNLEKSDHKDFFVSDKPQNFAQICSKFLNIQVNDIKKVSTVNN